MSKLKLDLANIKVESFETSSNVKANGTVVGNEEISPGCVVISALNNPGHTCHDATCYYVNTCNAALYHSCGQTCEWATCGDGCSVDWYTCQETCPGNNGCT